MSFQNRTIFITGASRGIGEAIALKLAAAGANIVIAAKSTEEDPRLGGTIFSVAKAVEKAGGKALPVKVDIREEAQIQQAVQQAVDKFGGIDVVINNASAIQLTNTEQTPSKRFDLMYDINVRGTFLVTQHCIPYLKKGNNPHILTLSPPVNLAPQWLGPHVAYTISKYNMSMLTLGWAEELKQYGIAANSLWPATTIATAAIKNLLGGEMLMKVSRKPDIMADAAYYVLGKPAASCTGNNFIDEAVLKAEGITDLAHYAVTPGGKLQPDLFL
ncbi:SDR family oxidoreductase [Chitinophaga qingshengii]|uniref:NAD(P)-dependent oxidoreductase n=1 Tax=Chitinophaga qingshengii TaxID=1569794 RepID=A0ABR7TVI6_9BACT|nr:NAD(P)-dependent oxidoreductase [Chitinophaga qingshengii]MBC9934505.1 NAD(P)-dependent oxidoreductase [Chitinophaga qingshengii]